MYQVQQQHQHHFGVTHNHHHHHQSEIAFLIIIGGFDEWPFGVPRITFCPAAAERRERKTSRQKWPARIVAINFGPRPVPASRPAENNISISSIM